LWWNARQANRTLIFFVMRLRFEVTANTKRSTLDRTPDGYGRWHDLVLLLVGDKRGLTPNKIGGLVPRPEHLIGPGD
jgi:hypothetical protein